MCSKVEERVGASAGGDYGQGCMAVWDVWWYGMHGSMGLPAQQALLVSSRRPAASSPALPAVQDLEGRSAMDIAEKDEIKQMLQATMAKA